MYSPAERRRTLPIAMTAADLSGLAPIGVDAASSACSAAAPQVPR